MRFTINFFTPDTNQQFVIEMSGGTLSHIEGFSAVGPDASIVINRSDLDRVIMGQATLPELLQSGVGTITGSTEVLLQLASVLVTFETGFEVLPGTAAQ